MTAATIIILGEIREELDAPIADVWKLIADFAHPERIAPTIARVEMIGDGVGAVRVVHTVRGLAIRERLLECDPALKRLRYEIVGGSDMPCAGVTSYCCTIRLAPLPDGRTSAHWRSEGTGDAPIDPVRDYLDTLYRTANRQIAAVANGQCS